MWFKYLPNKLIYLIDTLIIRWWWTLQWSNIILSCKFVRKSNTIAWMEREREWIFLSPWLSSIPLRPNECIQLVKKKIFIQMIFCLLLVLAYFFVWMKRKNDHVNHIWITEKNRKMLLLSINCIMGKKFSFLFFICLVDPFDYEYDYYERKYANAFLVVPK